MKTNNIKGINAAMEGYYKVSIVDKDGNIVWEQPELQKNLILNTGMNAIASHTFADCFLYGLAGTGNRVNKIDPGTSVLSQNGGSQIVLNPVGSGITSLTQSLGGHLISLQVGDVIQYNDGATATVVGGVSNLAASVDTVYTKTSQSFYVWKTSQTSLQIETGSRTSTYLSTANGSLGPTAGVVSLWRTYDFAILTNDTTYNEVGTSWTSDQSIGNIFSRILLPSSVLVTTGQKLRLYYQLNVFIGPTGSINRPNITIGGWPISPATNTNATESIQKVSIVGISGNGASDTTFARGSSLEPSTPSVFTISNSSSSLSPYGSSTDRTGARFPLNTFASTLSTYVPGSFTIIKQGSISPSDWNGVDLKFIAIGDDYSGGPQTYNYNHGWAMLMQQTQSKSNTQTLNISLQYTWGRTLTS